MTIKLLEHNMRYYKAMYDHAFKNIFSNEIYSNIIIEFLSKLLNMKVDKVDIVDKERPNNDNNTRSVRVDQLYIVNDYLYVHIELNSEFKKWMHYRNYLFFSNIVSSIPRKGQKYEDIDKFIHIDITWGLNSEKEIKDECEIDYDVSAVKHRKYKYLKEIKIKEFNMDKIMESWYNIINNKGTIKDKKIVDKYRHLIMLCLDQEELEILKNMYEGDDYMVNVIKVTNDLNDKWAFLNNYITDEEDYERCVRTDAANVAKGMAKSMAEDMAKDMAKDIAEDIVEKKLEEKTKELAKEQAIKMLNDKIDVNLIAKYTNLTKNEILNLKNNSLAKS